MQSAGTVCCSPAKWCFPCQQAVLLPPLLLLLPLRSCLLTGALLSQPSVPGRCHYRPLTPPCALLMKTFMQQLLLPLGPAAPRSFPASSTASIPIMPPSSLWDRCGPTSGANNAPPPPDIPMVGRAGPSWGSLTPLPAARSSVLVPAQHWALLGMDGTAFGVMKYLQVSGFVRNDRDRSIPFQGVIFFPFMASVPC